MRVNDNPDRPQGDRRPSNVVAMKGVRMESGSDVLATFFWGLRRYAVVVLAMVVALGVLVPVLLSSRAEVYQATAQVGPNSKLQLSNTNPLPRFAESVFNNGAVELNIRTMLKRTSGNIIPSKVQLIAAQDNVVLDVVAHAPNAEQAILIANRAAETFVIQLNMYENAVAPFVVAHQAVFAKKVPKFAGGSVSIIFGLLGGLLAGVALVGLAMVVRRPVVDVSNAQDVTGSPVIGRIRLPRHGPVKLPPDDRAVGLLGRLLDTSAETIHVAAPSQTQAERFAGLLTEVFGRMPVVTSLQKKQGAKPDSSSPRPMVVAPRGLDEWFSAQDERSYTVLLAPEGISARHLRVFAEEHDTGAPTGVVLVTNQRRRAKLSRKR
jgi:capsular polysaccharide biosynthesis protein